MLDNLVFRTARSHVYNLSSEYDELMLRHREAMNSYDCEAFLQLGIDAFVWLTRADQGIRKAVYAGRVDYDQEVDGAMDRLYRMWLRPCEDAEKLIARQESLGYKVGNVDEFRRCASQVKAIVKASTEIAGELAAIRDEAIEADRKGQTTDWEVEESAQPAI